MIREFVPIIGPPLEIEGDTLRFKGGRTPDTNQPGGDREMMGLYLCNQMFSGGTISATFTFEKIGGRQCAEIITAYDPAVNSSLNAGVPPELSFLCVRAWEPPTWNYIAQTGDHSTALKAGRQYRLEVTLSGSIISLR